MLIFQYRGRGVSAGKYFAVWNLCRLCSECKQKEVAELLGKLIIDMMAGRIHGNGNDN